MIDRIQKKKKIIILNVITYYTYYCTRIYHAMSNKKLGNILYLLVYEKALVKII